MSKIFHDTLSIAKRLQTKGFEQAHAEALAVELQEARREEHGVTKEYLDEKLTRVDDKLKKLELRLTVKAGGIALLLGGYLSAIKFFVPA